VIIEKPLALSVEACEEIQHTAMVVNLPALVMCQHRFEIADQLVLWPAETTALIEVARHRPLGRFDNSSWRGDIRESGGGVLAHLAIHPLDLACQLLGWPETVSVEAVSDNLNAVDTRCAMNIRFEAGAVLSLLVTCRTREDTTRLVLRSDESALELTRRTLRVTRADRTWERPATPATLLRAQVFADMADLLNGAAKESLANIGAAIPAISAIERARRTQ
jgi:predicted dehydrogenase